MNWQILVQFVNWGALMLEMGLPFLLFLHLLWYREQIYQRDIFLLSENSRIYWLQPKALRKVEAPVAALCFICSLGLCCRSLYRKAVMWISGVGIGEVPPFTRNHEPNLILIVPRYYKFIKTPLPYCHIFEIVWCVTISEQYIGTTSVLTNITDILEKWKRLAVNSWFSCIAPKP